MKKKKLPAILMAAALAVTTAGQTAGVLAAEFTDAETYVSAEPEEAASGQASYAGDAEGAAQWEDAEIFSADEWTADAGSADTETGNAEPEEAVQEPDAELEIPDAETDVFQWEDVEELNEAETPDPAETEEELFSADEPEEAFGDGDTEEVVSAGTATANYSGMMISKAEFEHLKETGEAPGREWVEKSNVSFANFMKNFSNKTGYLLVAAGNNQGYEDLVIPKGLTVVIACGGGIHIQSITANGNIYIWENVFTPGSLEIKKGTGSVTFNGDTPINGNVKVTGNATFQNCTINGNVEVTGSVTIRNCQIHGTVIGNGSNDTVTFAGTGWDNYFQGIQGVENVIFSEQCNGLMIGGSGNVEFYNIKNQTAPDCNDGNRDIYLNIEGYRKDSLPVFHKNFDLGISHGVNDEGTVDEWNAGIGVNYIKTFDTGEDEEWKFIDIGAGNPAVKFTGVSDVDILSMRVRMWAGGASWAYGIDMDGTAISDKEDRQIFFGIRYQSCDGVSAKEAFNREGREEIPDGCIGEWFESNTLENVMRALEADQKRGTGQGYYLVTLPRNYKGTETLTVPSSLKGVLYRAADSYNEETDVYTLYPAQVSSVNVPSGKTVRLLDLTGGTGTLKITGAGTAALINCRMNQNVTAGNLIIDGTTVKSLTCDKLSSERTWFAVEKSLKFNEASLLSSDIIAKAGAALNLGAINNAGTNKGDMAINLEVKDGKTASVTFAKAFNLGNVVWDDGGTDEAWLDVRYYDYAKAASVGANCAKNFYSIEFSPWDEEGKNVYEILTGFGNKTVSLMSFTAEATKSVEYMFTHMNVAYNGVTLIPMLEKANPQKVPLGVLSEDKDPEVTKTYFTVNSDVTIQNISGATVSAIAAQTYTGKALTPAVTVKLNGKTLKKGTDYTVTYKNNIKVGTATVTITGKGNYTGTIKKTFKIVYAVPKKGAKATVGTLQYQVTKSASKNGTVSVIAPKSKTSTSITIPATVKINGYTFNVTAIGASAFKGCTKLAKVTIGSKVTSIGAQAFYGCKSLKTITVGTSVLKSVGKNALYGINAKATVSVSYAKLSAYKKLFAGKGQSKTVTVANPVPAKGKTAQVGTLKYKITKSASKNGTVTVTAPVKKTYTSITIPSTVKIEGYNFKVTAVSASAFKNNTKLAKVTLGANLTTIGKEVFYGCKALKTITVQTKNLKTVGSDALKGIYKKAVVKVPSAKLTAYKKLFKGKGQSSSVKITK
ncbi:MAG: leucine-rich repeat protein [Eubacteriales bacterium]|nr:leucine-rich repeat protein [Eubacteriales bacterium]